MPALLRRISLPLTTGSTYLRWIYLILGCLLAIPFVSVATVVQIMLSSGLLGFQLAPSTATTCAVGFGIAAVAGTALAPVTRRWAAAAARELLGNPLPEPTAGTSPWHTSCWMILHLTLGSLIGYLTFVVAPFIVVLLVSPLFPPPASMAGNALYRWFGVGEPWAPVMAIALGLAGIYLVAGTGAVLDRLAPALLGPSAQERLSAAQRRVEQLAERNRLAGELHDSVGHTLSVVTLQAGAAARVLNSDPDFARQALTTIEDSTRRALEDLDHVLGLLRADRQDSDRPDTLAHLDTLTRSTETAGLLVHRNITGQVATVPDPVSREAYRVIREGLTNALRHGGKVPVDLDISVHENSVDLHLSNPLGATTTTSERPSRGLGLSGIRHRVAALGGETTAGAEGEIWHLRVRIPLRS